MKNFHHGMSKFDKHQCAVLSIPQSTRLPQTLGYLFDANPVTGNLSRKHIINAFENLADDMSAIDVPAGAADAGQTFFGQFIDHDITLDTTSKIGTAIDPGTIFNVRTPTLDLDCVYGFGPEASPHLYSHEEGLAGFLKLGHERNEYDLARLSDGRALIGDFRNDENALVAQMQGAFIALHNIIMTTLIEGGQSANEIIEIAAGGVASHCIDELGSRFNFDLARRFVRLHYQYLVANEFLPAFVDPEVLDLVADFNPFPDDAPIMPAEFSGAAYRFGHATVREEYCLNNDDPVALFSMSGAFKPVLEEHNIDFWRFFSTEGHASSQKAGAVGMHMAQTLATLPFIEGDEMWDGEPILAGTHAEPGPARKLALRNMLRDRSALKLQSGQQAARSFGLTPLPAPNALRAKHISKTPLWAYSLQEAGEFGHGRLTGVGGRIVAGVFDRILDFDSHSVKHYMDFEPWSGFGDTFNMGGLTKFVTKNRESVMNRKQLFHSPTYEEE